MGWTRRGRMTPLTSVDSSGSVPRTKAAIWEVAMVEIVFLARTKAAVISLVRAKVVRVQEIQTREAEVWEIPVRIRRFHRLTLVRRQPIFHQPMG